MIMPAPKVCQAYNTKNKVKAKMGWLVAIKRADFFLDSLPFGGIIMARAENTYSFENLREVSCELHMNNQLIAKATLLLYQENQP